MAEAMKKHVYWVSLQAGFGEKSVAYGFAFESPLPNVEAIRAELVKTGLTIGNKLKLVQDGKGGKLITERSGMCVGLPGLVSLQDYTVPVWEPVE